MLRSQLESPYTDSKVPSMDELRKRKNVLHPFMIERCEDLQPWEEVYHFLFFYILFFIFLYSFVFVFFCPN